MNVEQFPSLSATGPRIVAILGASTTNIGTSTTACGVGIDSSSNVIVGLRSLSVASGTNASPLTSGTHLIVMRYVQNPNANDDAAQPMSARTPIYRNIKISNVTATSPQSAGFLVGLPECVVSNVVFDNVRITAPKGLTVRNAKAIQFKNSKIEVETGEPLIIEANAAVEGIGK